ncbi:hypothetical protein BESB_048790 [Besnoitia besnoiti]|uniref:Uncharacterized protein n=1 Tax=Besnoitia besnoiti TaxID=94643 RepID=A0A2A9MLV6_BESBE|nr:hypothetical protein BESB_048790 [Besnoitia besnoiti]PFH36687.1 hypothetical protein BESB_048790 [Besnoitia besnoiti]
MAGPAKGARKEDCEPQFFKLAWPSSEKVTALAASLYKQIDHDPPAAPGKDLFEDELDLFECAVAEEGETPTRPPDFVPRGSKMRAILRDEIYRAVQDASESSGRERAAAAASKRVSIQFVNEADQDRLRVDLGRRVQWGGVQVKEFEKPDKEWDAKTEAKVKQLKSQYNGAELEVVYRLLVDEYMIAKPVILITPTGKKLRSSVCVNLNKLFVTKEVNGQQVVDVAVKIHDIDRIQFGKSPALARLQADSKNSSSAVPNNQSLYIVFKANARRSSATGLQPAPGQKLPSTLPGANSLPQPVTVTIVFPSEAERNSFALLLRTSKRLVAGSALGDWEDTLDDSDEECASVAACETVDELFVAPPKQGEEGQTDRARLAHCISAFSKGMNVQKATSKGSLVVRKLCLSGASLQLLSLRCNKGQIVGVFDEVLSVSPGQDDSAFRAAAKNHQLPPASRCAVVKLSDHSFALIFPTEKSRDNFVFMMKHLDESDEVLRYIDDGSTGEPSPTRVSGKA